MNWHSPASAENRILPVAALLAAGIALLLFVMFGQLPGDGRWASVLGNAAHAPAFAAFALIVIGLRRRMRMRAGPAGDYFVAFATAIAAGALVEVAQLATGRDATISDLLRDGLGASTAIALFAIVDPALRPHALARRIRGLGIVVGLIGTALVLAPLVTTIWAYASRDHHFPQLVDFSSPVSTYFLETYGGVSTERHRVPSTLTLNGDRKTGLHARVSPSDRWSTALWEPRPDWRGYRRLALDIANPSASTLVLGVRLRSRGQQGLRAPVSAGTIEIPPRSRVTRRLVLPPHDADGGVDLDLATIGGFVLHRHPANRAREFYVMRIWLET